MRRVLGAALLLTLPTAVTLVPGDPSIAAGEEAETCQGEAATLVGSPDEQTLVGTAGDDVMVSNGSFYVEAQGGGDLICVTGDTYGIRAGGGDDRVHSLTVGAGISVDLGTGEDLFVGNSGDDEVEDDGEGAAEAHDVIMTGGGADRLRTGSFGKPLLDEVDLGPGDDFLDSFARVLGEGASLGGGQGSDRMFIPGHEAHDAYRESDWVFDNRLVDGVATAGGEPVLAWSSFEWFSPIPEMGTFRFLGGEADEVVQVYGPTRSAVMGGGDDRVIFERLPRGTRVDGGPGEDLLDIAFKTCQGTMRLDLAAGTYACDLAGDDRAHATLTGVEDVELKAFVATVVGGPGPNVLGVSSCRAVVRAGAGGDRVNLRRPPFAPYAQKRRCRDVPLVRSEVNGGRGADFLAGSSFDDRIVGGPGNDTAKGRPGEDVCVAENSTECEG